MKWKITLMFRMGRYSYAKCFAQRAFLKCKLSEHCASLPGAVFHFLPRFTVGLMPSRGVPGSVTGIGHSSLILFPQRDKRVQRSGLVWSPVCFWLLRVFLTNVIILRCMYFERPANEGQFGLATGSRDLTGSCGSPLHQRGPATEERVSVSDGFTPLTELWSKQRRGETSPAVRSKRRRLSCAAQLCSAFPVLRKEGLSKQELLTLACSSSPGPGRVAWLWLRARLR